ncbi:MAG: ABC transporter substrate-binding protein [Pseudomonadota bacterium]
MGKRKSVWMLKAMVWVIFVMCIFSPGLTQAKAPEGKLTQAIHWPVSANWFDPATGNPGTLGWFALTVLHDALVKPMPDGTYTPCLAESYSHNENYTVYEFKLRKGVKFHNGDPLTAEDVVFSFYRYKSRLAKLLHGTTEKVEAVDPHLVRFQFKRPFPDFLEYFLPGASLIGWIVPKKYMEKVGAAGFRQKPVGAGPYKLVEFVPGVKLVVEAFEDYWRKVPNIKTIEFKLIRDRATRLAMVKRGEADVATLITDILMEEVKKDPNLRLLTPLSPVRFPLFPTEQWNPQSPGPTSA